MKKSLLTKVMALAMAAVMLFSFNTTSQAAAKKNIDTMMRFHYGWEIPEPFSFIRTWI